MLAFFYLFYLRLCIFALPSVSLLGILPRAHSLSVIVAKLQLFCLLRQNNGISRAQTEC